MTDTFHRAAVEVCDACGRPLVDELGFGDVALHGAEGLWGLLCLPWCIANGARWEGAQASGTDVGWMDAGSCDAGCVDALALPPGTPSSRW